MAKSNWITTVGPRYILLAIILVASVLRVTNISVNPPSLFGDELDLGYHAYSILKTGRDYQGNIIPLHFHSLAEWRTPLYLYSAVPTIAVFGITPLGVRLPAVIFGILGVWVFYKLIKELSKSEKIALTSAFVLAISPWHLQYSRAGFEVTQMLLFILTGVWLFFVSLKNSRFLWVSVVLLVSTPLIYSTAKLFIPTLLLGIVLIYRKDIFDINREDLLKTVIAGLVVGIPVLWSTFFGGGSTRFNYISVFSDPTIEPEVGFGRSIDARTRGETGLALNPSLLDRAIHNKFTFAGEKIIKNYLQSFSTEFLFIKGDPDPRHSIGIGEFYRIEMIFIVLGTIFFFTSKTVGVKTKTLIFFWILVAPIPAAITRDGGNHATRLILTLPVYALLIAYGLRVILDKYKSLGVALVSVAYATSLFFYIHEYYVHYPTYSERWWHAGWGEAISEIKKIDSNYDRVIISMEGEPAWIFFAGHYQYSPKLWQNEFPIGRDIDVPGFGKISHTGKFYFGSPSKEVQVYGLNKFLDSRSLYLANAKEVGENLITNPEKSPQGLRLIKSIPFPSGEPAFYLFSGFSP